MPTDRRRRAAEYSLVIALLAIGFRQDARAQQTLPQIDIGGARARPAPQATPDANAAQTETADKRVDAATVSQVANTPATVYRVGQTGIQLATGGGGTNPIRAISHLPSVDAPQIDAYGLANLPGGSKGLRVRGELSQHGNSTGLVEGLPISGINPGPGATWLIDNENIESVTLYQGPIAPTVNSFFTVGGAFDSRLRWPEKKMGGEISQSVGSSSFLRSFGRIDTGELFDGKVKAFASGSWTDAHQWRGLGKDPQGKSGFSVGLDLTPTDWFEAKLFGAKSSFNQNSYAGLTYQQVTALGSNRFYNFLPFPTNNTSVAVNYFGYNLQSFDSWTTLGEFTVRINEATRIVVKPYYFREDGYYLDGMNNGKIRKWIIGHDYWGLTSELQTRLAETDITLGYWHGVHNLPGPPTAWEMFNPTPLGGATSPTWPILARQTSPHEFNAGYGLFAHDFDALHVEAGARYIAETMPGITALNSTGIGDVPYSVALASSSGPIPSRSVSGFTVGTFLPYGAAYYDVTKDLRLKVSAGGGYGGPGYDMWPVYQQNFAALAAKGLTADQMWRSIRPETSAMIDAGFRYSFSGVYGSGYIEPTGYFSRNHNKLVSYDSGVGTPFGQNVGESQNVGFQFMGHYSPIEQVDLFASVGHQRNFFVADLPTLPGASAATHLATLVRGRQLPDVPFWIATLGGDMRVQDFSFRPVLHVVGSRMGDTSGQQPIPAYATLDLTFGYDHKLDWGTLSASLSIINVCDAAYIGQISNGYYQQTSSSGIYFPGAPRTVVAKVGYKF
jgi:iron complex outermembrane recepter protein